MKAHWHKVGLLLTLLSLGWGSGIALAQTQQPASPAPGQKQAQGGNAPSPAAAQQPQPAVPASQAAPVPAASAAPAAPSYPFNQNMSRAASEQGWSKLYFESYKRSHEARYMTLAGSHAENSIEILYETQMALPRTNRFHYVARSKRLVTCSYYGMLREASMGLPASQSLKPLRAELCQQF